MTHSKPSDFPFSITELKSGRITCTDAIRDISAILSDEKLGPLAMTSIGGSIRKEQFFSSEITDTNEGVLMWYCYNDDNTKPFPKLFLASQTANINDVQNNIVSLTQKLVAPTYSFNYNGSVNQGGVLGYLKSATIQLASTTLANGIDSNDVVTLSQRFDTMQKDATGKPFNTRAWAYFQNNKNAEGDEEGLLTKLVRQPNAVYIHYYFGYDEGATGKNRIRTILIAADVNHNNILELVVQRSIPPSAILKKE